MNEEERLSLNNYMEDLYQAMQIGDIIFKPKHSTELYNLINKVLEENKKYKEVIDKAIDYINDNHVSITRLENGMGIVDKKKNLLNILKEVEDD